MIFEEKERKSEEKPRFPLKNERSALKVQSIGGHKDERRDDETHRGNEDNKDVAAHGRDFIRQGTGTCKTPPRRNERKEQGNSK